MVCSCFRVRAGGGGGRMGDVGRAWAGWLLAAWARRGGPGLGAPLLVRLVNATRRSLAVSVGATLVATLVLNAIVDAVVTAASSSIGALVPAEGLACSKTAPPKARETSAVFMTPPSTTKIFLRDEGSR